MERQHEIAVRVSLGASRGSIIAQRITEAFVLSLVGGALGLVLATSASRLFYTLAAGVPRIQEMRLDWRLVVYTLACSVAVTVLCGLLPAFTATRWDMRGALAKAGRTQGRRTPHHLNAVARHPSAHADHLRRRRFWSGLGARRAAGLVYPFPPRAGARHDHVERSRERTRRARARLRASRCVFQRHLGRWSSGLLPCSGGERMGHFFGGAHRFRPATETLAHHAGERAETHALA